MIEVKNLVKKYGDFAAVDDISMTLEDEKVYGLLGPNGAGKTTTMNIITGYMGATSGTVLINGHDIQKEPKEARKSIGYLPEQPPLYTDMKVIEYMNFAADLKNLDKKTRRVDILQSMELTGIKDVSGKLIRNLSKGYRQRVGLAQAVLGLPDIIILDEPTVGLDPKQIVEIRTMIRSLGEKHTVILSSHILSEVSEICEYVYIINRGKLAAADTVENLSETIAGHTEEILLIKGTEEQAHTLSQVDGVKKCTVEPASQEGNVRVRLQANPNTDIRENISVFCAENGIPILEMQTAGNTLEDVFLELTGEDMSQNAPNPQQTMSQRAIRRKRREGGR